MTETATASSGPLAKILTPSRASGLRTSGTTLASSLLAVIIALGISAVMLFITGKDPVTAFTILTDTAQNTDKLLEMMRRATPLIFSATAVAIGFKMNLFNIGVEGQYLFAALMAAEAGSHISLPGPLHVAAILAVALISGAAWAGISAFLKVRKNIHEVISTIMLNYIALSFIQWIFNSFFRDDSVEGLNIKTTIIEESGRLPDLVEGRLNSMFIIALVVVAIFWVVVYRSKFGFKLRASGYNATAASTAGISAPKMTVIALLLSGAVAGLVAMQSVLGETHAYGPSATPIQL
ncbi:ABC transporter permease, partial [Actinomycetota bacterium]|nr:ABC transporter permease [Actinomycetota bacterium]